MYNCDYLKGNGIEWCYVVLEDLVYWIDEGVVILKYINLDGDIWIGFVVIDKENIVGFGKNVFVVIVI